MRAHTRAWKYLSCQPEEKKAFFADISRREREGRRNAGDWKKWHTDIDRRGASWGEEKSLIVPYEREEPRKREGGKKITGIRRSL